MKKWHKALKLFMVAAILASAVVGLQVLNGAYRGEFADNPDEPAHVVTGLMMRDYFFKGLPGAPMEFARSFYEHYPKVAIGHWPPVFYLAQTLWAVCFSPGRLSLMAFMAVVSFFFAMTIYIVSRELCRSSAAFPAALLFVFLPVVQKYSGMVMNDIFGAWLAFVAVVWFGKFLKTERWVYSAAFGVMSALSILTRGGSLSLGLVPVLAVVFTARFALLRKWSFWLPLLIVGITCGPWYWFVFEMMKDGFENPQGIASSLRAVTFYFPGIYRLVGIGFFAMALIGFLAKVVFEGRRRFSGMWVSLGAMTVSVPLFHCLVTNAFDTRYLIPALPGVAIFAVVGVELSGRFISARTGVRKSLCSLFVTTLILVSFVTFTFKLEDSRNIGFESAVMDIMQSGFDEQVWLVSSDAIGEGAVIANVALNEHRPGHFLLRSSRQLASSAWDGSGYDLLYNSHEQVRDFILSGPVSLVVADYSVPPTRNAPHNVLLINALESFPDSFEMVACYPCVRDSVLHEKGIRVFRVTERYSILDL